MKTKQHPITYEHIGYILLFLLVIFIIGSATAFWSKVTDKKEPYNDIWHCESNDGRINYAVVQSERYPSYLPIDGNEGVEYNCTTVKVILFDKYIPVKDRNY